MDMCTLVETIADLNKNKKNEYISTRNNLCKNNRFLALHAQPIIIIIIIIIIISTKTIGS